MFWRVALLTQTPLRGLLRTEETTAVETLSRWAISLRVTDLRRAMGSLLDWDGEETCKLTPGKGILKFIYHFRPGVKSFFRNLQKYSKIMAKVGYQDGGYCACAGAALLAWLSTVGCLPVPPRPSVTI